MVQLDPKKKNRLYDPGGRSAAPSAPVEEPQRKKAVQGFQLPFRELGQASEALGTAARSGARTAQALEGKAQDTNRFTVVDMAAPKEADSPAPLPAAERENGFRLSGVTKGVAKLARQTGDIARRGKETAFPQAPAERDDLLRQTRQTVQGAARGVQDAAKAAASLKLPGTGSAEQREPAPEEARAEAELLHLLADQTVQELEQELKAYRENVRIPLRAGSGYAAAELDTDSEEYRRGKALEQRLEYARIRQKKVGDLVVFTTDMAKIAAMTEEQRQDLWAVAQMKELWRGIAPNADNWSNPYIVNGQEEGHAAMQRLLEAGYSAQDVQDMAVTYQRSQNQAFMGQVRRTAQEMVDGGFLSAAGANLLTLPLQFLAGTAGTVDTAVNYVQYKLDPSAQRYSGLDPNLPWYAPSEFTGTVRQETREAIEDSGAGGKVLGYLYAGTTSAVDNLLRLYSAGGSQAVSLGLMGLNSFQDTARDVSARGGSPEQAIILGAISAGSEILTEKYSLEKLMDMLKIAGEAAPEMPRKLLRSILAQGGYEVAEEEMNLVINVFSDALVMGGNSEFNNQVAYWMESEGCTEAEAKNRAWEGLLRQAADTAIESFLSGEMMSGMGTAVEVGKQWNDARSYYRAEEAMGRVMERKNALSVPGESTQAADGNAGTQAEASQTGRTEGGEEAKGFLAKRAATIRAALMEEAAYQRYRRDLQTAAPLFGMKAEDFTPELSRLLFEDTEQGRYWREQLLRAEGLSAGDGGARQTLGGQEASSRQGQTVPQNGQGNVIPFRLPQQAAQTRQGQTAAQNQQGNAIPFRLPQQGIAQTRQGQTAAQNQQGNVIPFRLPQQAAQTRQGQAALQPLPVAGNNAMQLPGQTTPGNTAQGGPMLRLAQSQGSAILQTPQAFGGSAQQAPQMQGGVGVLTPPGQGGAALPGQQNQSGPAALQPAQGPALQTQTGQATPQGQQTERSAGYEKEEELTPGQKAQKEAKEKLIAEINAVYGDFFALLQLESVDQPRQNRAETPESGMEAFQQAFEGRPEQSIAEENRRAYIQGLKDIGAASTTLDTLDKFLEAKYNHSREFNREYFLLNGYTKAIADAEIFPIVTFETYKEFASEVEEKILGITTSNGIEIESYATHFINRVIGQFADSHRGTRRGTPIADVMDTLLNPVHIKPPVRMSLPDSKESNSRREDVRQKFIGKNATVVISTTDNRLVQANPYSE